MIDWHWQAGPPADWTSDRGLAYGDGLFETIRLLPQGPVLWAEHRDRLLAGCRLLGLPFSEQHWEQWTRQLQSRGWLDSSSEAGHLIKLIITRGSGGRGYRPPGQPSVRVISSCAPAPPRPPESVVLYPCRTPVSPCPSGIGLKSLSRLAQVLAARELPEPCFEGLMSDNQGRPVEGTRSNLFALRGNLLYTPPVSQLAVAGVMRRALLEQLPDLGLEVTEQPLTMDMLAASSGVFMANSVMGVVPVAGIGDQQLAQGRCLAEIRQFVRARFGV